MRKVSIFIKPISIYKQDNLSSHNLTANPLLLYSLAGELVKHITNWKSGSCGATLLLYIFLCQRFWLGVHLTRFPVGYVSGEVFQSQASYFVWCFYGFEEIGLNSKSLIFKLKPPKWSKVWSQRENLKLLPKKCKFFKTQKTAYNLEATPRIYSKTHHKKSTFHTLVMNFVNFWNRPFYPVIARS